MTNRTNSDENADSEHGLSGVEDQTLRRNNSYVSVPVDDTTVSSGASTGETAIAESFVHAENRNAFATLRDWSIELIALLIAFLSFGAMTGIISAYHDEVQPDFTYKISINTLVAVFLTILRATLLFVTSEGQSKWRWMKESPRPLRHIERFDDAGKGAWGSLKMFSSMWKPSLALAGALVVIASYAIGPFSQQATTTYSCERITGAAKIMIAEEVRFHWGTPGGWKDVPSGMAVAAITGLMYGGENSSVPLSNLFQCDSGNCTFNAPFGITHSSLGVCNKCTDTGNSIEAFDQGENGTNYGFRGNANESISWPTRPKRDSNTKWSNGFLLSKMHNATFSVLALSAASCATDSAANDWPGSFRHCNQKYGVISATDGTPPSRDAGIVAVNCTLSPCVYHYKANITNGALKESVVFQEPMVHVESSNGSLIASPDRGFYDIKMIGPCFFEGNWYESSNVSEAPRVGDWRTWRPTPNVSLDIPSSCARFAAGFYWVFENFIDMKLAGACRHRSHATPETVVGSGAEMRPNEVLGDISCDSWWIDALYKNGNATQESIKNAFDGLATAMTNYMRTDTWRDTELRNKPPAFVAGSATHTFICIRAEWQWLLYPGILPLLTAVLLAEACIRSHRDHEQQPVWKSAILPFLFYDIKPRVVRSTWDRDGTREAVPLLKLRDLERLADRTVARFDGDRRAPGFVVENVGSRDDKGPTASGQR
ncbi:hypothetical protein CSOJ01_02992 [Colletotrichum sojae]|uniref:Uncharacterized protein n=1 Tax=Colletotrichum sojae TaxID=2175907 RepID=A0A8H6JN92_9PEZI|nr:hypothetical protein CSOJ01_02992 [Colletotrichum sojae]